MISVDEHLARVLSVVQPLAPLELGLLDAHGCVLDEDVSAPLPLPGFDNSAMDGYAVRSADVSAAAPGTPVVLDVTGDVAAGDTTRHVLAPGTAMRIMTGAPLPEGADAVVPVERRDPTAERDVEIGLVGSLPDVREALADLVEDLDRGRAVGAGQDHGELLAAVPTDHVGASQPLA